MNQEVMYIHMYRGRQFMWIDAALKLSRRSEIIYRILVEVSHRGDCRQKVVSPE